MNSLCERKDRLLWQFFLGRKNDVKHALGYSLLVIAYWNNFLPKVNQKKDTILSSFSQVQNVLNYCLHDLCGSNLSNSLFFYIIFSVCSSLNYEHSK